MLDIIFFAIVAVFIAFRLRSVLGQKTDEDNDRIVQTRVKREYNREKKGEVVNFPIKDVTPPAQGAKAPPPLPENIRPGVEAVIAADKGFSLPFFLNGAKKAFEMVLKAYVEEDERTLKNLLSKDVFDDFYSDMEEYRKKGQKKDITLVSVLEADVTQASVQKSVASLTVRFLSEQIEVIRNRETGEITEGNPSKIEKVEDTWVFTRNLRSTNPNWKLASANAG